MGIIPSMAPVHGADNGERHAVRGALIMSVWTLLSRILGFVRDAFMLSVLGASSTQGAFLLAWTIPNLFRRLLGEGAVSAAVQPALVLAAKEEGEAAAKTLFAAFQGVFLLVLAGLILLGEGAIFLAYRALGENPLHHDLRETLWFSAALLPYLLPICLCALAAAPQNLRHRFLLPSLAPVILNVVWIVGLWWTASHYSFDFEILHVLWIWVLAGGFLQWGLQWPGLKAIHWPLCPCFQWHHPRRSQALKAFLPALLGMAALQINVALDQVLVRALVNGEANNYTFYANRMLHLPLALVGIAAMTGAMPLFSRLAASKQLDVLSTALRRGCESSLLLIIAAAVGLAVIAHPALTLLFEHGSFTADDVGLLVPTLRAYLWVLPFATLGGLLTRAHQSLGSYKTAAWAALASIPVNLGLDWFWLPRYGVVAAGWATTLSLAVQCGVLWSMLPRLGLRAPVGLLSLPELVLPGLSAGGAAALVLRFGPDVYTVFGLAVAIVAGVGGGAMATWVLRPQDLQGFVRALARKKT